MISNTAYEADLFWFENFAVQTSHPLIISIREKTALLKHRWPEFLEIQLFTFHTFFCKDDIFQEFASVVTALIARSSHISQILSNEERRSNFDRYGQMDENQQAGQAQHHSFRGFHNNFFFDESFFHFPRYPIISCVFPLYTWD